MEDDRWPKLCDAVAEDDGLPVRPARYWTEDKLYFWNGYIHITTMAMVGKPTWPGGLVYIDLFGGPGVCKLRSGRRVPGSPLIAAHARKPFTNIVVCEEKPELAAACRLRLNRSGTESQCQVLEGDCNELVQDVLRFIPDRALTLAFIDPTGLHANFETLKTLTSGRQADLLILFADRHDIIRNVDGYYRQGPESKLDKVLGPKSDWRRQWTQLANQNSEKACKLFADIYKNQLRQLLGYEFFREEVMSSAQSPLYRLIFASKHELGVDFWDKATKKYASGQGRLFR